MRIEDKVRKEDKIRRVYPRSDRLFQTQSGWFFNIRQGAAFGPYDSKQNAVKGLDGFKAFLK